MTKQLAERHEANLDVELWLLDNDKLLIDVHGDDFAFNLETTNGKEAMEMYYHPFAYHEAA
jgi:hypothetical protein